MGGGDLTVEVGRCDLDVCILRGWWNRLGWTVGVNEDGGGGSRVFASLFVRFSSFHRAFEDANVQYARQSEQCLAKSA